MSLLEIDNAFNLATAGKLDVDPNHYQSFNVIYISSILNSYKNYKGKYILDYQKQLAESQKVEPTEEEKTQLMIESILEAFEKYKEKREYILQRLEKLQSGQQNIDRKIDSNERRRQYDERKRDK